MPLYTFKADDGSLLEREMTREAVMDLPADAFGHSFIEHEGRRYSRINCDMSTVGLTTFMPYDANSYPKVSKALPQGAAGADHTNLGEPIITSRRHEDEMCRRHGFTREYSPT